MHHLNIAVDSCTPCLNLNFLCFYLSPLLQQQQAFVHSFHDSSCRLLSTQHPSRCSLYLRDSVLRVRTYSFKHLCSSLSSALWTFLGPASSISSSSSSRKKKTLQGKHLQVASVVQKYTLLLLYIESHFDRCLWNRAKRGVCMENKKNLDHSVLANVTNGVPWRRASVQRSAFHSALCTCWNTWKEKLLAERTGYYLKD